MSIKHKFYSKDFKDGFLTQNGILKSIRYDPEVMFIGTFNHGDSDAPGHLPFLNNHADFFYGRNYFWPVWYNIVLHLGNFYTQPRQNYDPPLSYNSGVFTGILKFCEIAKFSFADLIATLFPINNTYSIFQNKIAFLGQTFDPMKDNDLIALSNLNQVIWNDNSIVQYLNATPSIRTVYLTRQPNNFGFLWNSIRLRVNNPAIRFRVLFPPSKSSGQPAGIPKGQYIADQWLGHYAGNGYDNLDLNWYNNLINSLV